MARRADADESIELLVTTFADALTSGSISDICAAALMVADHGPERRAVGVLWEAFDAVGPSVTVCAARLALGRRIYDIYGRDGDVGGQWRIACRLLLAQGTTDEGWGLLYHMLDSLGPEDETAWKRAFHTLQGYVDAGDRLPWNVADELLIISRKRPS